eukprot:scaffold6273_cov376-Prasinococcus_capsulatus_cf.AAC.1
MYNVYSTRAPWPRAQRRLGRAWAAWSRERPAGPGARRTGAKDSILEQPKPQILTPFHALSNHRRACPPARPGIGSAPDSCAHSSAEGWLAGCR